MMLVRLFALLSVCLPSTGVAAAEAPPASALAAETVFHYEDLDRAVRFYRDHLGLVPVETREDAVVLEIAPGALLTLATLESGGYGPETPRTAAIALVTDQLDAWWSALSTRGLSMRTKAYDPVPGRAHHGFVLVDPEGWFLEFERFNPHPENVDLMPRLDALPTRTVDAAAAGLPEGLGFKATILWFYYDDLGAAEDFVLETLELPLVTDQGWAKIHPLAPAAYLGLVDGARGMHGFTADKAVRLEVIDGAAESRARAFETALGGVTNSVLEGPGDAVAGLRFPEGRIHFLAAERQPTIAELTEHYPDATYTFSFDTPSGRVDGLPVTFDAGGRNPGPIRLVLRQGGEVVAAHAVDASRDLEVAWTPFEKGAEDPLGIADDMIYVIFGNCLGEETVHSGHAISDGEALTFRDVRFTIPAAALRPGEPFQLEVEHSEMDTDRQLGIETIVTWAATTFLDIRTLGESTGERSCPAVPWAMDGGQTDRERPERPPAS